MRRTRAWVPTGRRHIVNWSVRKKKRDGLIRLLFRNRRRRRFCVAPPSPAPSIATGNPKPFFFERRTREGSAEIAARVAPHPRKSGTKHPAHACFPGRWQANPCQRPHVENSKRALCAKLSRAWGRKREDRREFPLSSWEGPEGVEAVHGAAPRRPITGTRALPFPGPRMAAPEDVACRQHKHSSRQWIKRTPRGAQSARPAGAGRFGEGCRTFARRGLAHEGTPKADVIVSFRSCGSPRGSRVGHAGDLNPRHQGRRDPMLWPLGPVLPHAGGDLGSRDGNWGPPWQLATEYWSHRTGFRMKRVGARQAANESCRQNLGGVRIVATVHTFKVIAQKPRFRRTKTRASGGRKLRWRLGAVVCGAGVWRVPSGLACGARWELQLLDQSCLAKKATEPLMRVGENRRPHRARDTPIRGGFRRNRWDIQARGRQAFVGNPQGKNENQRISCLSARPRALKAGTRSFWRGPASPINFLESLKIPLLL